MRDPFALRRIIYLHRTRQYFHPMPRCKHKQFKLSLITRCQEASAVYCLQWIQPKTCLCIRKGDTRLKTEPEIGEPVGKCVFFRHVPRLYISAAYYYGRRRLHVPCLQQRYVTRIMLAVTVKRYHRSHPRFCSLTETRKQRLPLASV